MTTLRDKTPALTSNTKISEDYNFNPTTGLIEIKDLGFLEALYILNLEDNIIIYNPSVIGLGGVILKNQLTLDFDVSAMNRTDKLLIIFEREPDLRLEVQLSDHAVKILQQLTITNDYLGEILGDRI